MVELREVSVQTFSNEMDGEAETPIKTRELNIFKEETNPSTSMSSNPSQNQNQSQRDESLLSASVKPDVQKTAR
jgi:hypothetical protein